MFIHGMVSRVKDTCNLSKLCTFMTSWKMIKNVVKLCKWLFHLKILKLYKKQDSDVVCICRNDVANVEFKILKHQNLVKYYQKTTKLCRTFFLSTKLTKLYKNKVDILASVSL